MNNVNFGKVRRTIFISLLVIAFSVAIPMQLVVRHYAQKTILNFKQDVQKELGLEITYHSLSPSILSNFAVKNVLISEVDGNDLLQIDRIKIVYKLIPLIKGDYQKGFENIVIDGIRIDVDQLLNIIDRLNKDDDFEPQAHSKKEKNAESKTKKQLNLQQMLASIPHNVKLKNIILIYSRDQIDANLTLREIGLVNNKENENLKFQLSCRAKVKLLQFNENITGNLNINGTIQNSLDGSQMSIKLTNLTDGNYTLNRLSFLASYNEKVFDIRTIQSVIPLFIGLDYNTETSVVNLNTNFENLRPATIVSTNRNHKAYAKIKNLMINNYVNLSGNLSSKEFDFVSAGNIYIPDELYKGAVSLDYDVFGDEKHCQINKFVADGTNCSAEIALNLIYETLQLSGLASIPYFVLPNGNVVSSDIYFDPLDKGFMAFAPQLFLGEKSLTALELKLLPQNDSYDFSFEAYDYSDLSEGEPGLIKMDGSYLSDSKYVQASMSLNSLFVSSLIDFGTQVVNESLASTLTSASNAAQGFMLSGDTYFSTDFKSLSYNVPYILFANTKKDNQVLMFSANGNEQEVQLNQLSLVYGKYALDASALVNMNPETKDLFFTTDVVFGNVPYHYSGTVMKQVVSVNGDYNTQFDINFDKKKGIYGILEFENMPLIISNTSLMASAQTDFSYTKDDGPYVNLQRIEIEIDDSSKSLVTNPKILFGGNITKYGAALSTISYSDLFTTLEGNADFTINFNQSIFDSAGLTLNMGNPLSSENLHIDALVSNPDLVKLNSDTIKDSLYLTMQAQVNNFGLNRFVATKSENNRVTGNVYASGTINHPYVSLNIEKLAMQKGKHTQTINMVAFLEDKDLIVESLNMTKGRTLVKDCSAKFSLEDFTGSVNLFYHTAYAHKEIDAPLVISIEDATVEEGKFLPTSFIATLKSENVSGNHFKKPVPLDFTILYSPEALTVMSGEKLGLYLTYLSNGECNLSVNSPGIMRINGSGTIGEDSFFDIYDIDVDVAKVFEFINYDNWVIVENGNAVGSIQLTGSLSEPKLNGLVNVYNPAARVPIALPVKLQAEMTPITIVNNDIYVNNNTYSVKGKQCLDADCRIVLNGWGFDYLECFFKSVNNEKIYGELNLALFQVQTDMIVDLYLYYGGDDRLFEIDGSIWGDNVYFNTNISNLAGTGEPPEDPLNFVSTLDLTTGTHGAISFDPLIRTVIAPKSKFRITCDNKARYYHIDGKVDVKSGDIAYLSRNFYIKSGNIDFNTERLSNPKITLQAETREKDEKGQTVKIILNVDQQYLLDLNPKFSSVPPKSETAIMSLLGQIALADSNNATDFLFAAGGYAIQTSVGRKLENKLRQMLNFDILSLRTNFLQNTLSSAFENQKETEQSNITIGNLFDNSTVYIGKYLGSDLYVDAMLNVTYEERKIEEQISAGNLIFQPEFGMELESPLGNIRWNIAPDINALLNKQYVPSTAVTLSWKFAF